MSFLSFLLSSWTCLHFMAFFKIVSLFILHMLPSDDLLLDIIIGAALDNEPLDLFELFNIRQHSLIGLLECDPVLFLARNDLLETPHRE